MKFSPFNYLRLLIPIPLFAWYWAGKAMHKLELEWVRANPASLQSLEAACQSARTAVCDTYLPTAFAHGLSLTILLMTLKIMLIAGSMPQWPQKWRQAVLRNARLVGGIGLALTLLMVIGRGVVSTLTVWFIPKVWWGHDALAFTAIIGLIAVVRIPPHARAAWSFLFEGEKRFVGRIFSREEAPHLWRVIDQTSSELDMAAPEHLVLGLAPDCRIHAGKVRLEPEGTVFSGNVIYLGTTLTDTLPEEALRMLLTQTMLERRNVHGAWFSALQDWLADASAFLQHWKSGYAGRRMASAADPALHCWEGWLATVEKLALQIEAAPGHASVPQEENPREAQAQVGAMLEQAKDAWRQHALPRLMLGLSNGASHPRVMEWFAEACGGRPASDSPAHAGSSLTQSIQRQLVLLERQWLIDSGQITVPD